MIDKKELRIGNWVAYGDKHYQIEAILKRNDNYALCFKGVHHGVWIDSAEPIELTEDLILKCGFQPKYFGIKTYYSPLMELDHDFHLMGVDYGVKIKHLHQLQNLYFALTGKELEVEL